MTGAGAFDVKVGNELFEASLDFFADKRLTKLKPVLLFLLKDVQLTDVLLYIIVE